MRDTFSVLLLFAGIGVAVSSLAAPGDLDTTFGTGGKVFASIAGATASAPQSIATDSAGNIYVGATTMNASPDFSAVKFLPSGALDTTFGNGGKVVVDVGASSYDSFGAIAVDESGNVFLAGASNANGGTAQFTVVKLTRTGAVDTAFGVDGRAFVPNPVMTANDSCCGMTLGSGGEIYLAGASYPSGYQNAKIAKLTSAGDIDSNFGSMGYVTAVFGHSTSSNAVIVDGDGSLFVEGSDTTIDGGAVNFHMVLMHFDAFGQTDLTFGQMGALQIDIGAETTGAALARDVAGNFYVVGESNNANYTTQQFGVAKVDKNGNYILNFGTGGKAPLAVTGGLAIPKSAQIDKDGNLYLTGIATVSNNTYTEVTHIDGGTGTLITTFGTNGQSKIDFLNGDYGGVAGVLDASGRLYVTANMGDPTSSTISEFVAARLITVPTNEIFSAGFE